MSQRRSQVSSRSKTTPDTQDTSRVHQNTFVVAHNDYYSTQTPNKNLNTSHMTQNRNSSSKRLSSADVSRLTGKRFEEGQVIKGESRISYIPFEKKVVDYETRIYTQLVPKTRKVIDYHEKKVIQNVPRQVVKQEYYPVQKITQYYKEIVDVKPVQKKVKKLQYVPVEKQIVHYPQNQDYKMVQTQSKIHFHNQGIWLRSNVQYRPIQKNFLSQYQANPERANFHIGSPNMEPRKTLSKQPVFAVQQNISSSRVQEFNQNEASSKFYITSNQQFGSQQFNPIYSKIHNLSASRSKNLSKISSSGNLSSRHHF